MGVVHFDKINVHFSYKVPEPLKVPELVEGPYSSKKRWFTRNYYLSFMKGFMYILKCSDGSYYTGSTNDIDKRFQEHLNGLGANYTKDRLPVEVVYVEEFSRIDLAFNREKQVQGWSRKKKEALINNEFESLPKLSRSKIPDK